ncbi:MAG TPA: hypothetical protein VLF93_00940 [Candidatus Saccharimonadales bacterium]|nr:hypothetical protein [Candidatus Saccharimonadales bacterium]
MDFFVPHSKKEEHHPFIIQKSSLENGAVKVFQDHTGHAEKTEIILPKGKIVIIKDYEQVPMLAHYKSIEVLSPEDSLLGRLEVFPQDKEMMTHSVRIFQGTGQIGTGSGNIGMAIARKFISLSEDPRLGADSFVDPEVIDAIKEFLSVR